MYMSWEAKLVVVMLSAAVLVILAAGVSGGRVKREEKEVVSRCEAACSPMAYTGFHDDDGCWCRVEDPNTLKRELP